MRLVPTGGHRLGRRGLSLLFFGVLDVVYSFSLLRPDPESREGAFLKSIAFVAPLWVWSILWGVTGLLCLTYAFRTRDQVGFTAAIFLKVTWAFVCMGGWLLGDAPRGYVSVAIWLAAAGFVWVISGWPETAPRREEPEWTSPRSTLP